MDLGLTPETWIMIGAGAWGLVLASVVWVVLDWLTTGRRRDEEGGKFEAQRRERLRAGNSTVRAFQGGVDKLGRWNAGRNPALLEKVRRGLLLSGEKVAWKPEEFLAARQIESGLLGVLLGVLAYFMFEDEVIGLGLAIGGAFLFYFSAIGALEKKAKKRLAEIKRRLPFAIDLMALMMEAGASFQDSMGTVVKESQGHPMAEELTHVLREIALGRTRSEAMLTLQNRLNDDDVTEIVFAVNKGEELGTPLGQILRNQAEQMRLKKSQWAEKASGEAQVNIVFPGMVIMIACLLIVVAPFILNAIYAPRN
jgi:tight adherence protein C